MRKPRVRRAECRSCIVQERSVGTTCGRAGRADARTTIVYMCLPCLPPGSRPATLDPQTPGLNRSPPTSSCRRGLSHFFSAVTAWLHGRRLDRRFLCSLRLRPLRSPGPSLTDSALSSRPTASTLNHPSCREAEVEAHGAAPLGVAPTPRCSGNPGVPLPSLRLGWEAASKRRSVRSPQLQYMLTESRSGRPQAIADTGRSRAGSAPRRRGASCKATERVVVVVAEGAEVAKTWLRGGSTTLH